MSPPPDASLDQVGPGSPVGADLDPDDLRAADGRVPGRRGRATRQRLLDRTAEMLKTGSYRDLKVVDIARGAGTSPATFYQYFPDVEAAILVLTEDMAIAGAALDGLVRNATWRGRAAYDSSMGLVDGVLQFWDEHRSLLRVVDLATEEGDNRFRKLRSGLLNPLTRALADVVEDLSRTSKLPDDLDRMATAGVLVSMLAHVAAHQYGFEFWGIRSDDLRRNMARIIYTTLTGQKPPPGS